MVQIKQAAIEHELKRLMRPDAHHFIRPDWRRFVTPGAALESLYGSYERKFRSDQPRVPAGVREGGRWTSEGGARSGQDAPTAADKPVQMAGGITGFTRHGINQTISRGVSPPAILDAVVNPIQILPQANGTTRYIGAGAVVVLNPAGGVVTVWGR